MRVQYTVFFKVDELDTRIRGAESDRSSLDESLVAIQLVAGEHDLKFSASHLDGRTAVKLTCRPGEVVYLLINASSNENFWNPALVDWHIDRTDAMPEPFVSRPLFLMYDGQWYTESEPGR